jgi:multisubunit Na+/H+ antiporter MnhB subunit
MLAMIPAWLIITAGVVAAVVTGLLLAGLQASGLSPHKRLLVMLALLIVTVLLCAAVLGLRVLGNPGQRPRATDTPVQTEREMVEVYFVEALPPRLRALARITGGGR